MSSLNSAPNDAPPAPCAQPYEVGYGKPPKETRFKPGQSGNPKGRPRGAKSLNTLVLETLGASVTVRTPNGTRKISRIEAVLQKTIEQAISCYPARRRGSPTTSTSCAPSHTASTTTRPTVSASS